MTHSKSGSQKVDLEVLQAFGVGAVENELVVGVAEHVRF